MCIHRHPDSTMQQRLRHTIAHFCRSHTKRDSRILSHLYRRALGLCLDKLEIDLTIPG